VATSRGDIGRWLADAIVVGGGCLGLAEVLVLPEICEVGSVAPAVACGTMAAGKGIGTAIQFIGTTFCDEWQVADVGICWCIGTPAKTKAIAPQCASASSDSAGEEAYRWGCHRRGLANLE